jgi:hypothetical protein
MSELTARNDILRGLMAFLVVMAGIFVGCSTHPIRQARTSQEVDICIYGATSAGVVAAVAAVAEGCSVVLLDCDRNLGGLTTAGLGATDVGNKQAVGGLAREFYRRLRRHYDDEANWTRESRGRFRGRGHAEGDDCAWTFEPSVARSELQRMLSGVGVEPIVERLQRGPGGVEVERSRILALTTDSGRRIRARVFLDCTYEGDLLAAAGCSYAVGREANDAYGETLNGVQVRQATKHQFDRHVDPYVVPGDPASGLLPGIDDDHPADGAADRRVQAYCFRLCATDDPANRLPWPKPDGYDERDYELLLRWYDAGSTFVPWHPVRMPNRKTDSNNNGAFSTDYIGANWAYPEASYEERDAIVAEHRRWQMGLMWTLANHPRVPAGVRARMSRWGLCRDEFEATSGWPPQIYVREGRRLVGELVVTEHHCMGRETVSDPVGLGAYAMDSHNVRRHVVDGSVRNEGDVQVRVPEPYGISYRALQPRRQECTNLLVPVAVSSSHIAFGSIRMEPVFMLLAHSAAVAASMALKADIDVQDVDYATLREALLRQGQVLDWDRAARR